jgi:hypothetical protein
MSNLHNRQAATLSLSRSCTAISIRSSRIAGSFIRRGDGMEECNLAALALGLVTYLFNLIGIDQKSLLLWIFPIRLQTVIQTFLY